MSDQEITNAKLDQVLEKFNTLILMLERAILEK